MGTFVEMEHCPRYEEEEEEEEEEDLFIFNDTIEKRARKCRPFVFPLTLKKIKKNLVPTGTTSPLTLNPTTYNLNHTHREEEEEDTLTSEPVLALAQKKSQKSALNNAFHLPQGRHLEAIEATPLISRI